jgi:hypothetical protein
VETGYTFCNGARSKGKKAPSVFYYASRAARSRLKPSKYPPGVFNALRIAAQCAAVNWSVSVLPGALLCCFCNISLSATLGNTETKALEAACTPHPFSDLLMPCYYTQAGTQEHLRQDEEDLKTRKA